jgi:tRNA(Ile)-lysidine synthase
MVTKMLATITENGLIMAGDAVVVGLSGGPDSVALFRGLLRLEDRFSLSLSAAHLNHKLRGDDSDEDERFVRDLTEKYEVKLILGTRDVKGVMRGRGGSVEEKARAVRYAFLREAAQRLGATKIALGHTLDDNAETVVMNLIRGSGLRGLSGIPLCRRDGPYTIIRPLLEVTRKEILSYLKKEKQAYREDLSNLNTSLTRNRIRHELLPLLAKEYNPRIHRVLAETGRNLRDAEESVSAALTKLERECTQTNQGGISVSIGRLKGYPRGLWRELVRRLLRERFGVNVDRRTMRAICQLVAGTRTRKLGLGEAIIACREYDDLLFLPERALGTGRFEKELRIPCDVRLPELGVEISASIEEKEQLGGPLVSRRPPLGEVWCRVKQGETRVFEQLLDASALPKDTLVIRTRREGDAFRPLGMRGNRKIKELFIDEKVPMTLRARIPILCCGGEIMWIVGYRAGAKFAVRKSTARVLRVTVKVLGC